MKVLEQSKKFPDTSLHPVTKHFLESHYSLTPPYSVIFNFCQYNPDFSEELKQLEFQAGNTYGAGFFRSGMRFPNQYHQKALEYEENIIVCITYDIIKEKGEVLKGLQKNRLHIIGATTMVLQKVYAQNKIIKAGFMSDLRVDERFRRLELATAVIKIAEDYARKLGSELVYFMVNFNNTPALQLYKKLNYVQNMDRYPLFLPFDKIQKTEEEDAKEIDNNKVFIKKLTDEETKKEYEVTYGKNHMFPVDFDSGMQGHHK